MKSNRQIDIEEVINTMKLTYDFMLKQYYKKEITKLELTAFNDSIKKLESWNHN